MEAELLDYLIHIRPTNASTTYLRKQWQIQSFAKHLAAKKKTLAEVKKPDVEEYLLSRHYIRASRQGACAVIREFYNYHIRHDPAAFPLENPAAKINFLPDHSERLFKPPSQAAVNEIFGRLSDASTELRLRDRLMAELAYGSGLRRSELVRLNIEDVDFESGIARVIGKGSKARYVPLTTEALETFRTYQTQRCVRRGPLLVSAVGKRLGGSGVYSIMRHRVGLRPHLMRHACATHMLRNGCGVRLIQELLGHSKVSTTYTYTAVEKSELSAVIGRSHPRAFSLKKP